jgi:hypothetical protein
LQKFSSLMTAARISSSANPAITITNIEVAQQQAYCRFPRQ